MKLRVRIFEIPEDKPKAEPTKTDDYQLETSTVSAARKKLMESLSEKGRRIRSLSYTQEGNDRVGLSAIVFAQ